MIPQSFIDELIARADIVEVVGNRVQLKKAGREFSACCPFHSEKTPSFTVSPQKQFYHCFGCGAHGTALGFLMDYDHLDFIEAVKQLAGQFGLEVPTEAGAERPKDTGLAEFIGEVSSYYREQLKSHQPAIDYLKGRGIDGKIAAEFGLGYAPGGWDTLAARFGRDAKAQKQLAAAGLVIQKDSGGFYDRFRERVMFPIRDRRGRTIGFGGRVLGSGEPKYLNSPETELFHKGSELYGLFEARQALRDIPRLLVVEGYMDVIALAQHDIRYAVATLGTATTPQHLQRLFRITREVVFCFDGDRAGRAAAWRALETTLPEVREGRQIRFLFVPEGEDPDSLVRAEGAPAFEARIKSADPLSKFLLDRLAADSDLASIDGRARLAAAAKPLIARIPDAVYRQLLLDELAKIARLSTERLTMLMKQPGEAASRAHRRRAERSGAKTPMQHVITLLLQQPALAELAGDSEELARIELPGMGLFVELLEFIRGRPHITTGGILEHWRQRPEGRHLEKLAAESLLVPEDGVREEFVGRLNQFRARPREQRFEALRAKPLKDLSPEEKAELRTLSGLQTGSEAG
ncbi:MAG TPA: DNA primase [Gammaproteobacteria bacterium]|nr:DNA primase [Gammaproteobacteria bacterium]